MMPESALISDVLQDIIKKFLSGTKLGELSRKRPEIDEPGRIHMLVIIMISALQSENKVLRKWLNNARAELEPLKDKSLGAIAAREIGARAELLEHFDCKGEENVDVIPLFNYAGYHWKLDGDQVICSEEDKHLEEDVSDDYFDKEWRSKTHTMVRTYFQSTDSDVLMIFENKLEVT